VQWSSAVIFPIPENRLRGTYSIQADRVLRKSLSLIRGFSMSILARLTIATPDAIRHPYSVFNRSRAS
jgi:hypothetical protein